MLSEQTTPETPVARRAPIVVSPANVLRGGMRPGWPPRPMPTRPNPTPSALDAAPAPVEAEPPAPKAQPSQAEMLSTLEAQIASSSEKWIQIAEAVEQIVTEKLFRAKYDTIADFSRACLGGERSRHTDYVRALKVHRSIGELGMMSCRHDIMPTMDHARRLQSLTSSPDELRKAAEQLIAAHEEGGAVSARDVSRVVEQIKQKRSAPEAGVSGFFIASPKGEATREILSFPCAEHAPGQALPAWVLAAEHAHATGGLTHSSAHVDLAARTWEVLVGVGGQRSAAPGRLGDQAPEAIVFVPERLRPAAPALETRGRAEGASETVLLSPSVDLFDERIPDEVVRLVLIAAADLGRRVLVLTRRPERAARLANLYGSEQITVGVVACGSGEAEHAAGKAAMLTRARRAVYVTGVCARAALPAGAELDLVIFEAKAAAFEPTSGAGQLYLDQFAGAACGPRVVLRQPVHMPALYSRGERAAEREGQAQLADLPDLPDRPGQIDLFSGDAPALVSASPSAAEVAA